MPQLQKAPKATKLPTSTQGSRKSYLSPKQSQANIHIASDKNYLTVPSRNPIIETSDYIGRTRVQFIADKVTINDNAGFNIEKCYISNNIKNNSLGPDTNNQDTITQRIKQDILGSIYSGAITAENFVDVRVGIDYAITTNSTSYTSYTTGIYDLDTNSDIAFSSTGSLALVPLDKKAQFKRQLKRQMAPAFINHRGKISRATQHGADFAIVQQNEIVALHLLRTMIPQEMFRKYLKSGSVSVAGPSGLTYQIQRKSHNIRVWRMGALLCTLCVYVSDKSIPPTDEVVTKMLICECDEIDLWRRANVSWRQVNNDFRKLSSKTIEHGHLQELLAA